MHALVFTAPGQMELRHVDTPSARAGEVLIDVRSAGICGSELHGFRAVGMRKPPLIMGHEFAGVTADGRAVVVNPLLSCGWCERCVAGDPQLCRSRQLIGVHRAGGFGEQVAVPADCVHDLPAGLPWESAAMVEPLANAVHAWDLIRLTGRERVAIIGAGTIGLVCTIVARKRGVENITVIDRADTRLSVATRLGAADVRHELVGEFDVVIDAVGAAVTRRASVERLCPGGTAVWLGLAGDEPGFAGNDLVRFEKRVIGSFAYTPQQFTAALSMAGEADLGWAKPITLAESQRVFMSLADGALDPVKAVIVMPDPTV